jgi:RND family efflux transporter MFP subunit
MDLRKLAPVLVLVGGIAVAAILIATGPTVEPRPPIVEAPRVRVITVAPKTIRLTVYTHGTVAPRTESELVPEVSGRVTWVSPSLVSGGFFSDGQPLLKIEPLDYLVGLEQSRARLTRAESDLANAQMAHSRQMDLSRQQASSESQRDDAINRLRVAEASKREADASLEKAQRDLERTTVIAPYVGRVRSKRVDVGQFVNRGNMVAKIYAVDFAEVRLPIPDEQLAYLDLPLVYDEESTSSVTPVTLRARFAGKAHEWQGEIVRTEGELDPRTRMVNVVARVPDPYARSEGRPPLAVGLFVEAEIFGTTVEDVVVLPRTALRGRDRVLIVDREDRLRFRDVDVLRVSRDEVLVQAGLTSGDRVCVSQLETPMDGMQVRIRESLSTSDRDDGGVSEEPS